MDYDFLLGLLIVTLIVFYFYEPAETWDIVVTTTSPLEVRDNAIILSNDNSTNLFCENCSDCANSSCSRLYEFSKFLPDFYFLSNIIL